MPEPVDPLAQLRPIHWPEPVSWWPPAPIWWAILALLGLLAVTLLWRSYSRQKTHRQSPRALLDSLQTAELSDREFLLQLNLVIKQIALDYFDHKAVATLTGSDWLMFLDAILGGADFVSGAGRILETGPYSRNPQIDDREALLQLCRQWANAAEQYRKGVT